MIIKEISELAEIRRINKEKIIAFCSGAFDLTHVGHILFFEDCKKLADILIVGVGGDDTVKEYKGNNRPILNESIRAKTVDSFKSVDYTIINHLINGYKDSFEALTPIFNSLRPNLYVINEDAFDIERRKKLLGELGIEARILPRYCPPEFDNVSTTSIIERVISSQ